MPTARWLAARKHNKSLRNRLKAKVFAVQSLAFLCWTYLFVPKTVVEQVSGWDGYEALLQGIGATSVAGLAAFVFFTIDPISHGNHRYAEYFRSLYPKNLAVEKFNCSINEASNLWFDYFDTWGLKDSPHHDLLQRNYNATYGLRAVYYLQASLALLVSLTVLVGVPANLSRYSTDEPAIILVHLLALAALVAGILILAFANQLPSDNKPATGCWARVTEVLGRERVAFEQDVLGKSTTLTEAREQVAEIRLALDG